jgi:quercetin dioxygenase-like cupin family protein
VQIDQIPFGVTDWAHVTKIEHPGESGVATWRTRMLGDIRVRMVEYSPGYAADHWCLKGHILLVLDGSLTTQLGTGKVVTLTAGSSYHVADGSHPHRSMTSIGARLFIVD